jgi:hypothetical protein
MNPFDAEKSEPNFWLSCMIIDPDAMCKQVRGEQEALYVAEAGKSCPTEILEAIASINAEGRPIWKPMHMQPIYRMNGFVTREGMDEQKQMLIFPVAQLEKMADRWMWEWIYSREDFACQVITK